MAALQPPRPPLSADRMVVNDDGTMVQVAMSTSHLSRPALTSALAATQLQRQCSGISGLSYPSTDGKTVSADDGSGTLSFGKPSTFDASGDDVPLCRYISPTATCSATDRRSLAQPTLTSSQPSARPMAQVMGRRPSLPDLRGRVIAGQDDMGGSSANRLTNLSAVSMVTL